MDPFESPFWPQRLVEIWVGAGSREAIRFAAHDPGTVGFANLSLSPDGLDDEKYDDHNDSPAFANEEELIYALIIHGYVRSSGDLENAKREVCGAQRDGWLRAYPDPNHPGEQFFRREDVLKLWSEQPVVECPEAEATSGTSAHDCRGTRPPTGHEQITEPPGRDHLRPISEAKLERWYLARMKECEDAGRRYHSRDEDLRAAREEFGQRVARKRVRDLRRRFLPNEVRRGGAPRKHTPPRA